MIESGFLGLYCDHDVCAEDEWAEPAFLDEGFQVERELRQFAAERGWTYVERSGAPWRSGEDYCPQHKPEQTPTPENIIEIKG